MKKITWDELKEDKLMSYDYDDDDPYPDVDDDYGQDSYEDDDEYVEPLSEDEFVNGATSSFPFSFTMPSNLNDVLHKDAYGQGNDNDGSYKKKVWAKVWPNVTPDKIDPAQAAADYYLLFGLVHNSFVEFQEMSYPKAAEIQAAGELLEAEQSIIDAQIVLAEKKMLEDPRFKLTELSKKADILYHNLVENLDKCFREYVHLACGGELRHHQACNDSLGGYRRGAWVKWYYVYEQNGPDSLLKMAELFEEFGGGSYGGPPWANAARILHQRETGQLGPDDFTNKQLFVDRVFTLEHNGGCFLNKLDWINLRKGRESKYARHFAEMKDYVLNAHAANPTNIDMLLGYASQDIIDLTLEYFKIATDNDIEIIGSWAGKKKVAETTITSTKSKSKAETGIIDWSDVEDTQSFSSKEDELLALLEKSLLEKTQHAASTTLYEPTNWTTNHVTWEDLKVEWVS